MARALAVKNLQNMAKKHDSIGDSAKSYIDDLLSRIDELEELLKEKDEKIYEQERELESLSLQINNR